MKSSSKTALTLCLALALSACGDSDEPDNKPGPSSTASSSTPTQSSSTTMSSEPPSVSSSAASSTPAVSSPPASSSVHSSEQSSEPASSSIPIISSANTSSSTPISSSSVSSTTSSSAPQSSSVSSSSQASTFSGDADNGKAEFAARCNFCHVDQMNGEFTAGAFAFSATDLIYPTMAKYSGYSADTVEQLAEFIDHNMPSSSSCTDSCADDIAAYIWSYRLDNQSDIVSLQSVSFDESGLQLELDCDETIDNLQLLLTGDDSSASHLELSAFNAVQASAGTLSTVNLADIAQSLTGGTLELSGGGEDIWLDQIFFNGLQTGVTGDFDFSLTIDSVNGDIHPFSKVGILLSNEQDLSGELHFLHWTGENGLAEDSGLRELSEYNQLHENPNGGTTTQLPVTLRVVYQNNQLRIGSCYNCSQPALQQPAFADFSTGAPRYLTLVASSHNDGEISAQLRFANNNAQSPTQLQQFVSCSSLNGQALVSNEILQEFDQVQLQLYWQDELISQQVIARTFSASASCADQQSLLEPQLRRLSQTQIKNSITDIFGDLFEDNIWPDLEDGAKLIGMNTAADKLNINSLNLERLYDASRQIVDRILQNHSAFNDCAASNDSACVNALVEDYGKQLWRRPLNSEELAQLNELSNNLISNENKLEFALNALLLSSDFLFRIEAGELIDGHYQLNNFELISLLSYSIWNSTPDSTLLALAEQSQALSDQQIQSQVTRMLEDPRATDALMEMYKDYLKLDLVLSREKADEYQFGDPVRRDILASAEEFLKQNINQNMGYMNVFNGSIYFINDVIAPFFNQSSQNNQLHSVSISSDERAGILNHPAFLAVHSTLSQSGIVKRGVFTLEQLLCRELPDPPGDVMALPTPAEVNPEQTSERDLLLITHSTQPDCVACHQFIDPAGFGFENFDAVGRFRTTEKQDVTIDASGTLSGLGDHVLSYNNSAEYSRALTSSPQMQACVAHRFLEHYLSQELSENHCELKKYEAALHSSNGNVQDLLKSLVLLESFRKRAAH